MFAFCCTICVRNLFHIKENEFTFHSGVKNETAFYFYFRTDKNVNKFDFNGWTPQEKKSTAEEKRYGKCWRWNYFTNRASRIISKNERMNSFGKFANILKHSSVVFITRTSGTCQRIISTRISRGIQAGQLFINITETFPVSQIMMPENSPDKRTNI